MGGAAGLGHGFFRHDKTTPPDSHPSGSLPVSVPAAESKPPGCSHDDHRRHGAGWILHQVFSTLDADGDGKVSASELASALGSFDGMPPECSAQDAMRAVDLDGDGSMDFDEFRSLMTDNNAEEDDDMMMRQAFAVYDQDGDGLITPDELQNVLLGVFGPDGAAGATLDECRRMIRAVDLDGDGAVSFQEFAAMMEAAPTGRNDDQELECRPRHETKD